MFGCPRASSAPAVGMMIGPPVPMAPVSMAPVSTRMAVVSPYHERRSRHDHGRRGSDDNRSRGDHDRCRNPNAYGHMHPRICRERQGKGCET